jgi:acetyltransferase
VGHVLSENDKMIDLARKLGFSKKWQQGGTILISRYFK